MALSDAWREGRSPNRGIDLKSILDGAKNLSKLRDKKLEVRWAGQAAASVERDLITLDANLITRQPSPINGEIVDVIIGQSIHEIGHKVFPDPYGYRPSDRVEKAVLDTFGDYRVDTLVKKEFPPMYQVYLRRARNYFATKYDPEKIFSPLQSQPSCKEFLDAVAGLAVYGLDIPSSLDIPEDILDDVYKMMSLIKRYAEAKTSTTQKRILKEVFSILSKYPSFYEDDTVKVNIPIGGERIGEEGEEGKTPEESLKEATEKAQEEETEEETAEEESLTGTLPREEKEEEITEGESLLEKEGEEEDTEIGGGTETEEEFEKTSRKVPNTIEIEIPRPSSSLETAKKELTKTEIEQLTSAIEKESTDISLMMETEIKLLQADVFSKYGGPAGDITVMEKALTSSSPSSVRERTVTVSQKLTKVLEKVLEERISYERGFTEGKLSVRRLHRAGYNDKRVFELREKDEISASIVLLLDMSSSVGGVEDLIHEIMVAFKDSLSRMSNIDVSILSYKSVLRENRIDRHWDKSFGGDDIRLGRCGGGTPSGTGLVAAYSVMKSLSKGKQKLMIIHLTDGAPDHHEEGLIRSIQKRMKATGVDVITLGYGHINEENMRELYGNFQAVEKIEDLPSAVAKALEAGLRK